MIANVNIYPPTWWHHQMQAFPHYWSFVQGIQCSTMNFLPKCQWRGALMLSLICARTNAYITITFHLITNWNYYLLYFFSDVWDQQSMYDIHWCMMTSLSRNIFRVTDLLCGEFTGQRWLPRTKGSDAELWCFLWSASDPTFEQTMETPVVWDAITLIIKSL